MRFSPFAFVIAVALVSCGGGSSSPTAGLTSHATATFPPSGGVWSSSLGPWNAQSSGKLNVIAVDPRNANTMYVAGGIGSTDGVTTDTGVFKSTDGGRTWSAENSGLLDTTINAMTIDANGTLLAATETGGIARSIDGGASWHQVSAAQSVRQIVASSNGYLAAASDGVYASHDGATWTLLASTRAAANAVAASGSDVYAGLIDGSIARISNGNLTYLATLPSLDAPPALHALAVDPSNPSSMYASLAGIVDGIYSDALFHSTDAGATWHQVTLPSALRGAQAIAFSSTVAHRLYVAGTGLATTDDGVSFSQAQGYGDARALAVLPGDHLAIASDQGVAFGAFGSAFVPVTGGLPVNIVRSVAIHGSTMIVTMQDFAPALSTDGGATWQTLSANSTENGTAYINSHDANICYVIDDSISVSTNACASFTAQFNGGHLASTQQIVTDASSAKTYVLTGSGPAVATDGVHFSAAHWNVPGPVDIAVDPRDSSSFYVSSSSGGVRVWRSNDGGSTFAASTPLIPPGPSYPNDAPVLAVDPANSHVVIAVTETAVFRSTDGGATFAPLEQTMQRFSARVRRNPDAREAAATTTGYNISEHVAFVPTASGSVLLVANGGGAYASLDDGTTLHPITASAISHVFEGFSVDGSRVCVGTDGQGVICTDATQLIATAQ